jgi:hypothetical protein
MNIQIPLRDVQARLQTIVRGGWGVDVREEAERALDSLGRVTQMLRDEQTGTAQDVQRQKGARLDLQQQMTQCADLLEHTVTWLGIYVEGTADKVVPIDPIQAVIKRLRDPSLTE